MVGPNLHYVSASAVWVRHLPYVYFRHSDHLDQNKVARSTDCFSYVVCGHTIEDFCPLYRVSAHG
jgi:hypothetical protein